MRAILEDRIAGGYLLWGEEGIGKEALAIEFAKTVNCINPIIGENTIDSCDQCKSCKRFDDLSHPNFLYVFPLPAGKAGDNGADNPLSKLSEDQVEAVTEQIALKAADPYYKIDIPGANQIKISQARHLKRTLSLSAPASGRRVALVSRAEALTAEASNSFLKTLEEPHEKITIILTTCNRNSIMQTILSRCQQIRCSPAPIAEVQRKLIEETGAEPAAARLAASFSQGAYAIAKSYSGEELQSLRELAVVMLRNALTPKVYRNKLYTQIEEFTKDKNKQRTAKYLGILEMLLRDCYALNYGARRESIINTDMLPTVSKIAEAFPNADYSKAFDALDVAGKMLNANGAASLILLSLLIKIRTIFLANKI
ncbi:MAG: ATP-binding protein [Chloroflexota bacterium]